MENKLNRPALKQYSVRYSNLIIKELFHKKESISGKEILNNIPIKQISLFILSTIFKVWKSEVRHLKSPYFNYKNKEVQLKLKELMNLLSKHIDVTYDNLYPLLQKSVESTLLLIVSPLNYYKEVVLSYNNRIPSLEEKKQIKRFIDINRPICDVLLATWSSKYSNEELFDKISKDLVISTKDIELLLKPFSQVKPVLLDDFWLESNITKKKHDPIDEIKTVHTQFSNEKVDLLADSFEISPSLKKMLTINQKFMFTNDLFNGSAEKFSEVIDILDNYETKILALEYLSSTFFQKKKWDKDSLQVKEFLTLIERKFD